jgi:hypothetical protein
MLHSKIRDINFAYDRIVIGSSLPALLYSFLNNIPFVYTQSRCPHRFSFFKPDEDLSFFGIQNKIRTLVGPTGKKQVGISQDTVWEKLYFYLSLAGLNPLADKLSSIRIEDGTLKAFSHKARMAKIKFEHLIIFDAEGILGIPEAEFIPPKKYKVYDWINVRSGLKHEWDWLEDASPFVNHILFYPTDRIDGDQVYKDAIAISYLTEEMLGHFDYSDINARFKVLHMMKQAGIKGPCNGFHPKDKTRQLYRGVKIETSHREKELTEYPFYRSTVEIEFNTDSFDDVMNKNQLQESYVSTIFERRSS